MNNKWYSVKEKVLLFLLFLTSLASLFFFFQFKQLAFPEYNISFSTTRSEAAEQAKQFLTGMQIDQNGYKDVTVFNVDDEAKTYLETNKNVQQTATLSENNIDLWHFTTRFFKPLKEEEYSVSFLPNGRFVGFNSVVPENNAGASLTSEEAKGIAEQFLLTKTNTQIDEWKLIDINTVSRKNRVDHNFIWETTKVNLSDATYRKEITVIGDKIGAYAEYVKVPESWQRRYAQERSQNNLAQTVAEVLSFVLFGVSAVVFFIIYYRNNKLRLRLGSYIALATFIIVFLATLNSLPLVIFDYETTQGWEAFLGQLFLEAVVAGGMFGFINFFIIVIGEAFYRQLSPQFIALEQVFRKGMFTKQVNKSLLIGSCTGIISFGYVVLFYIMGRNMGFWSPAEINYNDIFSTYIPWIYPLFIGFSAAIFEEGVFRLFGIPFLIRFVKKPWIAVIITAFVWGFLHSNYPQSPWFARGIEVGIEGLLLGYLFLRFGVLTSIVSHYTFNALITSVALMSSASLLNTFLSFFFALLPLMVGIVFLIRSFLQKGFITAVSQLTNLATENSTKKLKEKVDESSEKVPSNYHTIITKRFVWITVVLSIFSIAAIVLIIPRIDVPTPSHTVTKDDALVLAKSALQTKGISAKDYQSVVVYAASPPDELEQEYILENANFKTVQEIYYLDVPTAFWKVRFFKPLEKEEYIVFLLPNGKMYSIDHLLPEDAKGKNISREDALQIAKEYLQKQMPDSASYSLVAAEKEQRKNRTDYRFSFENTHKRIKDATLRADVDILGDEPSGFSTYVNLPESWVREKEKTTSFDFIVNILLLLPVLLLLMYIVATFFSLVKKKLMEYKKAFFLSGVLVGFSLIQILNQTPTFFSTYPTSIPLETFIIETVLGMTVGQIMSLLMVAIILAMFFALWKKYIGVLLPVNSQEKMIYIRDSLIIGYIFPSLFTAYGLIVTYLSLTFTMTPTLLLHEAVVGVDNGFPALSVIDMLLTASTGLLCVITVLLVMYRKIHSSFKIAGILSLFLLLTELKELLGMTVPLQTALLQIGIIIVSSTVVTFVVLRVIKTNILAYLMILFTIIIFFNAWDLIGQENLFFQINGFILFVIGCLPIILFGVWKRRNN